MPRVTFIGVRTLPPADWQAILEIVQLKTLFRNWDAFKATSAGRPRMSGVLDDFFGYE